MLPEEERKLKQALNFISPFDIHIDDLCKICIRFQDTMQMGLDPELREKSSIKMFPTYVNKVPSGKETGRYLALDLGGTNYRILLVTLSGSGTVDGVTDRTFQIPLNIMQGHAEELFGYISDTLVEFLESCDLMNEEIELGFTFSFPCIQQGLNNATLVRWTKGFAVEGVEGQDVASLLQTALDKRNCKVKCIAVVNDTVGTLASCALTDPRCMVGLIIGTGTNAAYIEKTENIKILSKSNEKYMVINTEWGAFGEAGELEQFQTKYDKQIDAESLHPGKQLFEKMTSGMYMGEIVRLILLDICQAGIIFHGKVPEILTKRNGLKTRMFSDPERDPDDLFYGTHYMLTTEFGLTVVENCDSRIVRKVCQQVAKRAAELIATGIAAILRQMNVNNGTVIIGVDGSLYRFHPKFHGYMTAMIHQLRPQTTHFQLKLSADGSGRGAAAIAAAHSSKNH